MIGRSHSGPPWGGKRCACDRSSQVILGIAVSTRKMWTGEPEDGLDLNRGSSQREQGQQLSQSPYLQPGLERERKRNVMIEAHWRGELRRGTRRPATCAT